MVGAGVLADGVAGGVAGGGVAEAEAGGGLPGGVGVTVADGVAGAELGGAVLAVGDVLGVPGRLLAGAAVRDGDGAAGAVRRPRWLPSTRPGADGVTPAPGRGTGRPAVLVITAPWWRVWW